MRDARALNRMLSGSPDAVVPENCCASRISVIRVDASGDNSGEPTMARIAASAPSGVMRLLMPLSKALSSSTPSKSTSRFVTRLLLRTIMRSASSRNRMMRPGAS